MPRKKFARADSGFQPVQQQARALLEALRVAIQSKQAELERLKKEETALDRLSGSFDTAARATTSSGRGRPARRVDWSEILQQLPKQFRAADVLGIRAVAGKRSSEIFAAISRWSDGGLVKRKSRGLYEHA
jgi:hypothetical protein